MTDEKRAELLLDHYKDSFLQISELSKACNRTLVYMLALFGVLMFLQLNDRYLRMTLNDYIIAVFL